MQTLSPLRARLASFEHAYALATRLHRATGRDQYVVRTGNPFQPVHVRMTLPGDREHILALVI